jgi:N-formylglutamate amidohydrolase
MSAYLLQRPKGRRRPIVISCPHTGTEIPAEIAARMHPEPAGKVPDTDFFVHELYGFAPEDGITLLHGRYSRFVVDLNRDPSGKKLYADGRAETGLVPVRTFALEPIYRGAEPDAGEIERRVGAYYEPYHAKVEELLRELLAEFPRVLLYEAHSIRRLVPSIRPKPFPDMILGDQQGKTAAAELTRRALATLRGGGFDVAHNDPFMGGYLTRKFGRPQERIHALQLEMSQDVYMNEGAMARDAERMGRVQPVLRETLRGLAEELEK